MTGDDRDPGAESQPARWTFHRHLRTHPEVGDALRRRMQEYPEYRAWLEILGGEVLSTLAETGSGWPTSDTDMSVEHAARPYPL